MSNNDKIHCPNCNEDVPKTLYCLNCGYPLYKLEPQLDSESDSTDRSDEVSLDSDVDMSVEIDPSEIFMDEPEPEIVEVTTEPEVEIEVEQPPEPEIEDATIELEEDIEEEETPEPKIEEATTEPEEEQTPEPGIVEEETEPETYIEDETVDEPVKDAATEITPQEEPLVVNSEQEIVEKGEESLESIDPIEDERYMIDEISINYAPDPLTKEVMDNLAKNITLKVRLTKLLRDNAVKEETFKKLFASYVDQGKLWVSRRGEIINRLRSDMERMEQKLITAKKDYELLEIRKSIGDASDNEYNIKAPAFKWDIEHLDREIQNCAGGLRYLMDLQSMIPSEEVDELQKLAQTNYAELENVANVGIETRNMMKDSLSEALDTIKMN